MGVKDIEVGMKLSVSVSANVNADEYKTEIIGTTENGILLAHTQAAEEFFADHDKKQKYVVRVIVDNAMYIWEDVKVSKEKTENTACYKLNVQGNPKVVNRRKYPRLAMKNACELYLLADNRAFEGNVVNISAGGFAFASTAQEFADAVGKKVEITIQDFEVKNASVLSGIIIRSTDDNGRYIVGCRMPEDNMDIRDYVEKKIV